MTPSERLQAEKEQILSSAGFYITPIRLSNLMRAAGKISEILVKADTCISYAECRLVLRIVEAGIRGAMEKEESRNE